MTCYKELGHCTKLGPSLLIFSSQEEEEEEQVRFTPLTPLGKEPKQMLGTAGIKKKETPPTFPGPWGARNSAASPLHFFAVNSLQWPQKQFPPISTPPGNGQGQVEGRGPSGTPHFPSCLNGFLVTA